MGFTLYWRPGTRLPKTELPDDLKRELARLYWDHDGGGRDGSECELTDKDIPGLEKLAAQGVTGAQTLISAIRASDNRVVIWISGPTTPPRRTR
ncbi:hypothetical protein [Streptomyces sp. IBSBF 2435]|uniref:hypothetical protein n=1 Tax=Streptomyces sp. IBSBF 2435 TaxID=2903531 RepID=UPI002FDC3E50